MSIAFRIIKRIFALLFALLIIFIVGFLAWRILSSGNPESMEALVPNDALYALYERDGADMDIFRQEQRSITSGEKNYGYFAITDCSIIPDANQIQATLRYNNSTLRSTATDYSLSEAPARESDAYDVTLVFAIDLTPEDDSDNLGNDENSVKFVRCHGSSVLSEQKNLYNFRRFVFDADDCELDLRELINSKLLLAVYADIYYVGDINYENEPYGTLCLYDFKSANIPVEPSKRDLEALDAFK